MGAQSIEGDTTHRCPRPGSGVMPCCGRTPFDAMVEAGARGGRMTTQPGLVTCTDAPFHAYRIGWWTHKWWPTRQLLVRAITGRQRVDSCMSRRQLTVRCPRGRKPYWQALWRRTRLIRRPHRPWQAEITMGGCSCNARRGLTSSSAAAAARRLHAKRVATTPSPGMPVGGKVGVCWAALSEDERATCA